MSDHLLNKHLSAFNAAEKRGNREGLQLKFSNGYSREWFHPGQWLLATDGCIPMHQFQSTGDPCWCGSDNCATCAQCGFESHD